MSESSIIAALTKLLSRSVSKRPSSNIDGVPNFDRHVCVAKLTTVVKIEAPQVGYHVLTQDTRSKYDPDGVDQGRAAEHVMMRSP
jgi:hypothetical protein